MAARPNNRRYRHRTVRGWLVAPHDTDSDTRPVGVRGDARRRDRHDHRRTPAANRQHHRRTTNNSGSASVWKVWAGDITNPPTAKTVAVAVASSGNFTGSTTFFVGNKSGATIAFQGDIANIECSVTGASAVVGVTTHPFGIAAYGALTAAEEQHILETFVWPAWQGQTRFAESRNISVGDNAGMFRWFNPLDLRGELIGFGSATFIMPTVRTIANIGETAIGCPRPAVTTPLTPYRRR
jgi:hypothetical protein